MRYGEFAAWSTEQPARELRKMKAAIRSDCNQFIALTYLSDFLFPPDLTTWLHTQVIVVLLLLGEWLDTWNKPRKMQEN